MVTYSVLVRTPPSADPRQPEELRDEVPSGSSVRLLGGGVAEELDDPPIRLLPRGAWIIPAFLVLVMIAGIGVLASTLWPWVRPVELAAEDLTEVYRPPLVVDGRSWAEPGDLERDRFRSGFCGGLLNRILQPSTRAVTTTGRGERPGNAFTAAFPESDEAHAFAFDEISGSLSRCSTGGTTWQLIQPGPETGPVRSASYRAETSNWRRSGHIVVLQYANTVTIFLTSTEPDVAAVAKAYRERVAAVSRARE